jgi:hypothetical protein
MWLHQKMQFVHPPECGHTCYTLRVTNHYKSLANFFSCPLAEIHWYRSELTLRTLWLHHKMHFVDPPGYGHTLYSLRIKHHYKSLANFMSCFIANLYWFRSKGTLKTIWLHHKMHFVHPSGCGHTLYSLRIKHHYKSLANIMSCIIANFYWSRSKGTPKTMWLQHKMHFVHPQGYGYTLYSLRMKQHYKSPVNFMNSFKANSYWSRSKWTFTTMWLHHKMHFVNPPGYGHTLYSLRIKHHYKSLANIMSCIIANFYWSRSKGTPKTMWLHHKMHFVHPPGYGHTLNSLRINHHYKSPVNFMNCFIANFYWSRSKWTLTTMWLHHKMHFVHPPGCGHTLYSLWIKYHYKSLANFMSFFIANLYWSRSKGTLKNHEAASQDVAASQDALCTSSRMWAHSVQFENKTSL